MRLPRSWRGILLRIVTPGRMEPVTDRQRPNLPMTRSQVPLSTVTSFEIGGIASSAHIIDCSEEAVVGTISELGERRRASVLAGGSNVLASDDGTDDDLILWSGPGTCVHEGPGEVRVDASMDLDEFVRWCISEGLQGVEQLSGIPGTVGGAIVQNAGAYDHDIAGSRMRGAGDQLGVTAVQCVNIATGETEWRPATHCEFAYRSSWFKGHPDWVIVQSRIRLNHDRRVGAVVHGDVRKQLGVDSGDDVRAVPTELIRDAVLAARREKGHFLDRDHRSAGSFFKNPVTPAGAKSRAVLATLESRCDDYAAWIEEPRRLSRTTADGAEQFVAALLIMTSEGDQRFTPEADFGAVRLGQGANVLMNNAAATAADVVEVANSMRRSVWRTYQIELEPEVVFLGGLELEPVA